MKWLITSAATAAIVFGSVSAQAAEQLADEELDTVTAGDVLINDPVIWSAGDGVSLSTVDAASLTATSVAVGSTASGVAADFILMFGN